jgi:hypothetical protein
MALFEPDPMFVMPEGQIPAGPWRKVLLLASSPKNPAQLEMSALGVGFKLQQVHQTSAVVGYEGYYHYLGFITADLLPTRLGNLIPPLGLATVMAWYAPVSFVEQPTLDAAWNVQQGAAGAGGAAGEEAAEAIDHAVKKISEEAGKISTDVGSGLGGGLKQSLEGVKPDVGLTTGTLVVVGGLGLAFIWALTRKRR